MPGRRALRRIQFGLESTPGTPVAATARMRFNGAMLSDDREVFFPPELVGVFGGTDRSFIQSVTASCDLADTPLTPEQLPYLLAMLYGGPVTGVIDGTGSSGFRYVTTVPVSTTPANRSYTVEGGDDFEVERMDYAKATRVVLKGSQQSVCMMNASLIGQEVARLGGGFSATTLADTNDLLFAGARLFLDAAGAIGTTQIANQFLGFEITFEATWAVKYSGEGATGAPVWSFVVFTDKSITGRLTMEHDPAVDGNTGIKSQLRANTTRALRIDVLGDAYATPGTGTIFTGGRRGVRIDLPVVWTRIPPLEDSEGNSIITVEFESRNNAAFGGAGSITVLNEVSALP